jgi:hypothetical protein
LSPTEIEVMTCPACQAAATTPHWGAFHAGCRGCCARSIARSHVFFAARQADNTAGPETRKYRQLLEQVGGLHKPPIAHSEVMAAFKADAMNRQPQGETT